GDAQISRLDTVGLFLGDPIGVSHMASMNTGLAELGHQLLAGMAQERGLVEALADRGRGLGDVREVGKPDLTGKQGCLTLPQSLQLPAGDETVGSGAARHVALGLDPGMRAFEAIVLALVGLGEAGRQLGERQGDLIAELSEQDHALAALGPGYITPTPHRHETIIRTSVCKVKVYTKLISEIRKSRTPPGRTHGRPPPQKPGG